MHSVTSLTFTGDQVYLDALSLLPAQMKKIRRSTSIPSGFLQKGIVKSNDQFREYPRLAFLRDIYASLVDEVITAMTGTLSV